MMPNHTNCPFFLPSQNNIVVCSYVLFVPTCYFICLCQDHTHFYKPHLPLYRPPHFYIDCFRIFFPCFVHFFMTPHLTIKYINYNLLCLLSCYHCVQVTNRGTVREKRGMWELTKNIKAVKRLEFF